MKLPWGASQVYTWRDFNLHYRTRRRLQEGLRGTRAFQGMCRSSKEVDFGGQAAPRCTRGLTSELPGVARGLSGGYLAPLRSSLGCSPELGGAAGGGPHTWTPSGGSKGAAATKISGGNLLGGSPEALLENFRRTRVRPRELIGWQMTLLWAAPLNSEEQPGGAYPPGHLQGVVKEQQHQEF